MTALSSCVRDSPLRFSFADLCCTATGGIPNRNQQCFNVIKQSTTQPGPLGADAETQIQWWLASVNIIVVSITLCQFNL